jgi:hypothetical protein
LSNFCGVGSARWRVTNSFSALEVDEQCVGSARWRVTDSLSALEVDEQCED